MPEYLKDIDFGLVIGLSGLIVSIFGVIYTRISNKKSKVVKKIELSRGQTYTVFKRNRDLVGSDLELLWNKKSVENIFLLELFLINSGNKSLITEDFLRPIKLSFIDNVEILRLKLFSSSEFSNIDWINNVNEIELKMKLLEKGELIKFEIIYSSDNVSDVNIDLAILDGVKKKLDVRDMGYETTDRAMDVKLYSISAFHGTAVVYLILAIIFAIVVTGLVKLLGFSKEVVGITLLSLIISGFIVALNKTDSAYVKFMKFRDVKKWFEIK